MATLLNNQPSRRNLPSKKFLTRTLVLSVSLVFLFSCASRSSVLTQVNNEAELNQTPEAQESPAYNELKQILDKSGYQGVGLKFEADATLQLLTRVFSNPSTENRQIQLVYTGGAMLYDSQYKSLTVGGLKDVNAIVAYIQKNVPLKPPPPATAPK